MLRLLQTSDVHLGARHPFLGERAADQRERQFAAFRRIVDLAVERSVDLVVIAGDLFDSSVEPARTVERVAVELRRVVDAGIRTVILPGDHDAPGRASIYHVHDLARLAGASPESASISILDAEAPDVELPALNAIVTSRFPAADLPDDGWRIGVIHREPRPRDDEIASAGVDYLAIGGPHSAADGRAGSVSWAASGAPELVDIDSGGGGAALIITLDEAARPVVERRSVGQTRFERLEIGLAKVADQAALVKALADRTDPDLVLDLRLTGPWPDAFDLDLTAVEAALVDRFLRIRVQNAGTPPPTPGPLPPPDTIAGAFIGDLEAQVVELDAAGEADRAQELREALRLGRRLLAGIGLER